MLKSRFDGLPLHRFCFYHTQLTMGYTNAIGSLDNYIWQHPLPVDDSEEVENTVRLRLEIKRAGGNLSLLFRFNAEEVGY